jgi:hypothetical protein
MAQLATPHMGKLYKTNDLASPIDTSQRT